jgi:hypothetical protein
MDLPPIEATAERVRGRGELLKARLPIATQVAARTALLAPRRVWTCHPAYRGRDEVTPRASSRAVGIRAGVEHPPRG